MKKGDSHLLVLAVRTRLELATPCVTGMYSNQLNYRTSPSFSANLQASVSRKEVAKIDIFFETANFLLHFCN